LEDHGYSLCLHVPRLSAEQRLAVRRKVQQLAEHFPLLRWREQPTSMEILPAGKFDKGTALQRLVACLAPGERGHVVFYAGDSDADIPAFSWTKSNGGISVRVGGNDSLGAMFHLPTPEALLSVLRKLLKSRSENVA